MCVCVRRERDGREREKRERNLARRAKRSGGEKKTQREKISSFWKRREILYGNRFEFRARHIRDYCMGYESTLRSPGYRGFALERRGRLDRFIVCRTDSEDYRRREGPSSRYVVLFARLKDLFSFPKRNVHARARRLQTRPPENALSLSLIAHFSRRRLNRLHCVRDGPRGRRKPRLSLERERERDPI